MFDALYDFFLNIVFASENNMDLLEGINFDFGSYGPITLIEYLSLTCALISLITIVVLCCLFVYKIIKLIGGLIR